MFTLTTNDDCPLIQGVLNFMVGGQGEQGAEQEVRHVLQHSNLMSRSADIQRFANNNFLQIALLLSTIIYTKKDFTIATSTVVQYIAAPWFTELLIVFEQEWLMWFLLCQHPLALITQLLAYQPAEESPYSG